MSAFTYEFTGRRPSQAQVVKVLKEAIKNGAMDISIDWGENWLRFEKVRNWSGNVCWNGYGWFRSLGGDAIAQQLNKGIL